MAEEIEKGLAGTSRTEWERQFVQEAEAAIDKLEPNSPEHAKLLKYLLARIDMSERAMTQFYDRWNYNEMRVQAYLNLTDYEKLLQESNDAGKPPSIVNIVIPYTYATISTIVTYQLQAFAGRRPLFQVGSRKAETAEAAASMEALLQYQADHTRLVKHLFSFLQDGQIYGVSIMRCLWKEEKGLRTVWNKREPAAMQSIFGNIIPSLKDMLNPTWEKSREEKLLYAGNDVATVDPFMFLPDPRVPMHEVNKRGEFVFWRTFTGQHELRLGESKGTYKWTKHVGKLANSESNGTLPNASLRNVRFSGDTDLQQRSDAGGSQPYTQIDEGTAFIIPAELGLGDSDVPEMWLFTIANKKQIIRAKPLDFDHGMHPVVVAEPYYLGYGFGMPGMADWLGPLQDTMSWFINSHMHNVATAINNMFVVDPSMIEIQDLKNPKAGKLIRLKRSAYGQDVRSALHQLPVQDVTRGHIGDLEMMMKLSDALSSVTDNLRGLQDAGGRKTATEVRVSSEAGASRLAAGTRLVSAQAIVDLAEQMSLNTQQFMNEEMSIAVLGQDGKNNFMTVTPEGLVGDFNFPVHDGTLPVDKVAMLDIWQQILMGVAQDPELRKNYSLPKIFEYVAELGGARNIENFKVQVVPDEQVQGDVNAGNLVPLDQLAGAL